MEIATGILLGLSTLIFIGPVFFYLLKSSVEGGMKAGFAVALGIIIGDVIYVVLALKGLGIFLQDEENSKLMALAGGLLLVGMGIKYLFFSKKKSQITETLNSVSLVKYGLNGFLINFVNPFVIGVWVLFLAIGQSKFDDEKSVVMVMVAALTVIFLTDLLKALFADKLKKFVDSQRLKVVYKVFGTLMLLFGIRLIIMYL